MDAQVNHATKLISTESQSQSYNNTMRRQSRLHENDPLLKRNASAGSLLLNSTSDHYSGPIKSIDSYNEELFKKNDDSFTHETPGKDLKIKDHFILAVLASLFFWPSGVLALSYSRLVNRRKLRKNTCGANDASQKTYYLSWLSFFIGLTFVLCLATSVFEGVVTVKVNGFDSLPDIETISSQLVQSDDAIDNNVDSINALVLDTGADLDSSHLGGLKMDGETYIQIMKDFEDSHEKGFQKLKQYPKEVQHWGEHYFASEEKHKVFKKNPVDHLYSLYAQQPTVLLGMQQLSINNLDFLPNQFLVTSKITKQERQRQLDEKVAQDTLSFHMSHLCNAAYLKSVPEMMKYLARNVPDYELVNVYSNGVDQAIMARAKEGGDLVIAFKGTEGSVQQWVGNIEFFFNQFRSIFETGSLIALSHIGFHKAYKSLYLSLSQEPDFQPLVRDLQSHCTNTTRLYLTGHSRGGSLASLMAMHVSNDPSLGDIFVHIRSNIKKNLKVYTYGESRELSYGTSGNMTWAHATRGIEKHRYIHNFDLVPSLPPNWSYWSPFSHWGIPHHLISKGLVDNLLEVYEDTTIPVDFPIHFSQTGVVGDHDVHFYMGCLEKLLAKSKKNAKNNRLQY